MPLARRLQRSAPRREHPQSERDKPAAPSALLGCRQQNTIDVGDVIGGSAETLRRRKRLDIDAKDLLTNREIKDWRESHLILLLMGPACRDLGGTTLDVTSDGNEPHGIHIAMGHA